MSQIKMKTMRKANTDSQNRLINSSEMSFEEEWDNRIRLLSLADDAEEDEEAKHLMTKGTRFNASRPTRDDVDENFLDETLKVAIHLNCVEMVKHLIAEGAPLNVQDSFGMSPLAYAVEQNSLQIAAILLKKGADPNMSIRKVVSPLFLAVRRKRKQLIELLFESEADINIEDSQGNTVICEAIAKNDWDIVDTLLQYHPYIDTEKISNIIGFDVLNEYDQMLDVITKHGLQLTLLSGDSNNQFYNAIRGGNVEVVKNMLASDEDIALNVEKRITPLHVAAFFKQRDIAEILIRRGDNILAKDGYGSTPVDYFTKSGDLSMLTVFMTLKESCKDTYLFSASKNNMPNFVKFLLEHGADASAQDFEGCSPLHFACVHSDVKCAKLLLEFGADPNLCNNRGRTPLHEAKSHDVIELLFGYGADLNIEAEGETPFTQRVNYCNEPNSDLRNRILPFLRHIVRLKVADLFLSDDNQECWEENSFEKNLTVKFITRCEKEVEAMQMEKINYHVCLYDVLTASEDKLAQLAINVNLTTSVLSGRYSKKFPNYNGIIINKFLGGKRRRGLLDRSCKVLVDVFPKLPVLCAEEIVQYLCNRDLNKFLLAISSTCNQHQGRILKIVTVARGPINTNSNLDTSKYDHQLRHSFFFSLLFTFFLLITFFMFFSLPLPQGTHILQRCPGRTTSSIGYPPL